MHAYLATCDGDEPRVRSVSPIVDDDMSIWVTTFGNSRKVKQIKKNSNICLAFVEQPSGDKVASVIGRARIVTALRDKEKVWKLAKFDLKKYFPDGPTDENFCLLKIDINKVEWRDCWESKLKVFEPGKK